MIDQLIEEIKKFCEIETQKIITELEQERFGHDGAFNDNQRWADNAEDVVKDKGRNQPLVDTGNLENELSTASNWNLNAFDRQSGLTLTIPVEESFTDKKYDKLQTGGPSSAYISPRGNKMRGRNLPVRNFKKLSQEDATWVVEKLVERIRQKFA